MITIDVFKIDNEWDIGHTRRYIVEESKKLGFNSTELCEISIVINELCTNFIKHKAIEGTLIFSKLNDLERTAIQIVAKDKGPGIKNIDEVIQDGVSSKGTMGGGLGAIKRLMDSFEIYSLNNTEPSTHKESNLIGTIIVIKKWANNRLKYNECEIEFSLLSRPYPGISVNGDYYYINKRRDRCIFAVIDGLGHGVGANKVSKLASEIIDNNVDKSIEEILIAVNKGLRYTRGVVAGIIKIDTIKREFEYSAVGNIEFRYLFNGKTERLIYSNGLLGAYDNKKIKVHKKTYDKDAIITMCSDGIINKWDYTSDLNMEFNTPDNIANWILRDFAKKNDDATVLVALL